MSDTSESDKEAYLSSDEEATLALVLVCLQDDLDNQVPRQICHDSSLSGREYMIELLNGHPDRLFDSFRMDKLTFQSLCRTLRQHNFLQNDKKISVEEAVGMFLLTICHSTRNRIISERFQHSKETVSRHFSKVLRAMCKLACIVIQPPNMNETPPEILNEVKFMPWFENCVGAIDGTHVSAWAPSSKQVPYRGRKVIITQNVMCACTFNMLFTFVYTGWEGSANDSRILLDAIGREDNNFPMPPEGKYFLVDSGYTNMPGFLAPYRGERYHLRDYRGRGRHPRGPQELFNYRHSSLRNVIERCFGVLKARFPILKLMPNYPIRKQRKIPIACCALHNFIRMQSVSDNLFNEYQVADLEVPSEHGLGATQEYPDIDLSQAYISQMVGVRDDIAGPMWLNYCNS